jgi:hypothetical protein
MIINGDEKQIDVTILTIMQGKWLFYLIFIPRVRVAEREPRSGSLKIQSSDIVFRMLLRGSNVSDYIIL